MNIIIIIIITLIIIGILYNSYKENKFFETFINTIEITKKIDNQINRINNISENIEDNYEKTQLHNPTKIYDDYVEIHKAIEDKKKDYSKYQFQVEQHIQNYKLKKLSDDLNNINNKIQKHNEKNKDTSIKSIYNPYFKNRFNVKQNYETVNNKKITNKEQIDLGKNINEPECFDICSKDVKCLGASYNKIKKQCQGFNTSTLETIDDKNSSIYKKKNEFNINLNNGCLFFNRDGENTKYGVKHCKLNDKEQHFNIKKISNLKEYNETLDNDLLQVDTIDTTSTPFYVINPLENDKSKSKECLTLNSNKGISIEPCNLNLYQKWNVSNKEAKC